MIISLLKKVFFSKYYNFKVLIYILLKKYDRFICRGYFGGWNECFYFGKFEGKLYYYDVISLYFYIGMFWLLYGLLVECVFLDDYNIFYFDDFKFLFGFIEVEVIGCKEDLKCYILLYG